jgi:hypothetical protein
MHFLEVYNQLNQLHTSNMFNSTREFQTTEPTQLADEHQSDYLAVYNNNQRVQANHRWKVECAKRHDSICIVCQRRLI